MFRLFAILSALITLMAGWLIFLAVIIGASIATGWQIKVASREGEGFWMYRLIDLDRRLTYPILITQAIQSQPLFSPDGHYAVMNVDEPYELVNLNDDTTVAQLSGVARIWSPDGRYLAFLDNDPTSETYQAMLILSIDENGIVGDSRPLILDGEEALTGSVLWSPNSEKMAFLAYSNIGTDLLIAEANGSNPFSLVPNITLIQRMAWSPDGTQLAFAWFSPEDTAHLILSRINVDGTGLEVISPSPEHRISAMSWSPDGEHIAFVASQGGGLFVVEVASGQIIGAIDYGLQASSIIWSEDSGRIVFLSSRDSDFYSVRRDGRNVRHLTNTDHLNVLMP